MDSINSHAMETLRRDSPDFEKNCSRMVQDLVSKAARLPDVVESLRPLIASSDLDLRVEGVYILSTIISKVPVESLSKPEIELLSTFYRGRLSDHYKVISPLLTGILALTKYGELLDKPTFPEILVAMFQTISCQAQPYEERIKVYDIIKNVLRTQTIYLLDMGPDFVYGVISMMDGERDPRNLLHLFEWLPEFINTVKLGHLAEEMFEVMACYFPVDFRVPSKDSFGITRDKLASALKPCLCANPSFSDYVFPLVLEKLDSELQVAKSDSLELLILACKRFDSDAFLKYQQELWTALQKEMLKCPPVEVDLLLSQAIEELGRKIPAVQVANSFANILETNVGNLVSTSKMYTPTWKLLLAMSKSTKETAIQVLQVVQSRLITMFNITGTKEHKIDILNVLMKFMEVGSFYGVNAPSIPQMLFSILMQSDVDLQAIALSLFCLIEDQMNNDLLLILFQHFKRLFVQENTIILQSAFHKCIVHYKKNYLNEISVLVQQICEKVQNVSAVINNLALLSIHEPFTSRFLKFIDENIENNLICILFLNKALELLGNENLIEELERSKIIDKKLMLVPVLLSLNTDDLMNVRGILMNYLRGCTTEQQSAFLNAHFALLLQTFYANESYLNLVFILSGLLTNLHSDHLLVSTNTNYQIFTTKLLEISLNSNVDQQTRQISTELLANLVNKLQGDVDVILSNLETTLKNGLAQDQLQQDTYGLITLWITKSISMRGYSTLNNWFNLVLDYIGQSKLVASQLGILIQEECLSLSLKSNSNIGLLYRQRVFTMMALKLNDVIDNNTGDCENYLLAFGSLVQEVPTTILKLNLVKLMRLIILCLDNSNEPTTLLSIVNTIKNLIETKDDISKQYLSDFLPRLLKATRNNAMKVRIVALECLQLYTDEFYPIHMLLPHKYEVLKSLKVAVDDRKRLVRKEASEARSLWSIVGEPI